MAVLAKLMAAEMLAAVSAHTAAPGMMPDATLTPMPHKAVSNGSAGGGGNGTEDSGSHKHASSSARHDA